MPNIYCSNYILIVCNYILTHSFIPFKLNKKEAFWDWAITSLLPSLYPSSAPQEYPYLGIMKSGKTSNVLGIARIRQLRIKKGKDLRH